MAGGLRHAASHECWDDSESLLTTRVPGAVAEAEEHPEQRLERLVRTIDAEIIPRLVLARRAVPLSQIAVDADLRAPARDEIAEFARLVIAEDVSAALAYVVSLRGRGVALESVFLELLSPAARTLGDMWSEDQCDFADVTVGLWRLQQIVRELSPAFRSDTDYGGQGRRVLLVPAPGEQHTFGVFMVAEFFRRAGWEVSAVPLASQSDLLSLVRNEWFAVVGLSVSCGVRLEGLAAAIHAIRRASRNGSIGVMVGGNAFVERPELVALVGADATAVDGRQATLQAEGLLSLLATAK